MDFKTQYCSAKQDSFLSICYSDKNMDTVAVVIQIDRTCLFLPYLWKHFFFLFKLGRKNNHHFPDVCSCDVRFREFLALL